MIKLHSSRGQATTELILLIPLFVILTGGALCTGYMCWQGLKVQEAANLAARIQGQERVAGGPSVQAIQNDNGLNGFGDRVPDLATIKNSGSTPGPLPGHNPPQSGVYAKFYKAVQSMFGPGEQQKLFVPQPIVRDNSDEVDVVRVLQPPKFFGVNIPGMEFQARAYGGEDPHMYGLPRWGETGNGSSNNLFWQTAVTNKNND
jgi:hypothetical protein